MYEFVGLMTTGDKVGTNVGTAEGAKVGVTVGRLGTFLCTLRSFLMGTVAGEGVGLTSTLL